MGDFVDRHRQMIYKFECAIRHHGPFHVCYVEALGQGLGVESVAIGTAHRCWARHQVSAQLELSSTPQLENNEAIKQCSRLTSLCHKGELY